MINKIVNTLLTHLYYQINLASNAKSAFIDNAKEDALNILLVLKTVQKAKHTPVNNIEAINDLYNDIEKLQDNNDDFVHGKNYVLGSIKWSKLSINKTLGQKVHE